MKVLRGYSFPNDLKIRSSPRFSEIFRNGKRRRSLHFTIVYMPNSLEFPRLGISIGKSAIRSAVKRNRIKRILREVFRKNKYLFDSNDIIFVAKKNSEKLIYDEAEAEIKKVLNQISNADANKADINLV